MTNFTADIQKKVETAKLKIVEMYQKYSEEIFSQKTLQNKSFKDKACRIVMRNLKNDSYVEANSSLRKLHQGVYELTYGKE